MTTPKKIGSTHRTEYTTERSELLIYDDAKKIGAHTQNRIHKMGEAAAPLRKPSQRHSTLRGMDAHHVLRALNPYVSHLRATAASFAECIQLQQPRTELAADRASALAADRDRGIARADAQRRKEQNSIRQSAGGVEREREREESIARRRQSAGDVGRERK